MSTQDYDIAIIGMSGQFPGANNLEEFWQNLVAGKESLRRLGRDELLNAGVNEKEFSQENYIAVAGTLENIEDFAGEFFGYSPRDAALLDPQHRKLLEHAWHALEDAAMDPYRYQGKIGVYVGSSLNTYLLNNILSHPLATQADDIQQILFGNGQDYLATRIAYLLNLRGPALNIQTACSTSLVAVHEACQHLLMHQVDTALAGGVSISVPQNKGYLYSVDGILSPDGSCRAFDNHAAGTVFSSGLGIVVLKRLTDAIEDGDAIYAVIKSSAINNDGNHKVGYTAPSVDGQAEVIALAQAAANVVPEQIAYIETHGTGTQIGDPIEIAALQKIFDPNAQNKQFCGLGSLKSNIGHLDTAAGIAGLIKTTLALYHEKIPASLHCETPNTKINWQASSFYINTALKDWPRQANGYRYAGVSSFGIGGTNAHAILGDAPADVASVEIAAPALFIFSAKTSAALKNILSRFNDYCAHKIDLNLHSMARTLQQGRAEFAYRVAIVAESVAEVIKQIGEQTYNIVHCQQQLDAINPKSCEHYSKKELEHLAQLWLAGHKIIWENYYETTVPLKAHLPVYPFERKRYWIEPYTAAVDAKKLSIDNWFYKPTWSPTILSTANANSQPARLLVFCKEDNFNENILNNVQEKTDIIRVLAGDNFIKLSDKSFIIDPKQKQHYQLLVEELELKNNLPNHLLHNWTLSDKFQPTCEQVFQKTQQYGLMSLVYFVQAWEVFAKDKNLKITILTNRLNQVSNEGKIEPHKAPLLAAVKVIPKEYLSIQTQLLDIDAIDNPHFTLYQIEQVIRELSKQNYDDEEILYRGHQRWQRSYIPVTIQAPTQKPFADAKEKLILITGGLGQLGLDIADYFSQFKSVKLALLARTVLPAEEQWPALIKEYGDGHPTTEILQRIMSLRTRGITVKVFTADVAQRASLQEAIHTIESTMGKITGVIHAAGETVNGIIAMKTSESLMESYQAKVFGSYHLCDLFADREIEFMILCSSMNAIIGGLGQLDNTAANGFIDYLADYYAAQTGKNILAINWGAINVNRPMKVNVLHQFMDLSTEHKKNRMTDEEAYEIYTRILTHNLSSRIVISAIDFNQVLTNWNRVASLEELGKDRLAYEKKLARQVPLEQIPQTELQQFIAEVWQQLLGVDAVTLKDNFFELGGHSLAAVQLMTKVQQRYGLKTHVMNLYELPTLEAFSHYLEKQLRQIQAKKNLSNNGVNYASN